MSDGGPTPCGEARSQLDVYFEGAPRIDYEALCSFINACDPDESDKCVVRADVDPTAMGSSPAEGIQLSGGAISLGDFTAMLIGHNVPSPDGESPNSPRLPDPVRAKLAAHRGFVLVTLMGGEGYAPVERMVFCLKIAVGLCKQGGIGVGFPLFGMAYPGEFLVGMATSDEVPLWKALREEQEPADLLSGLGVTTQDGGDWIVSRGHLFYGLPDFAYKLESRREFPEMHGIFQAGLAYMLQNGPVLQPGHTFGFDENAAFRFAAPGPNEPWLADAENQVLIFEREGKKRKGLLGKLFGR